RRVRFACASATSETRLAIIIAFHTGVRLGEAEFGPACEACLSARSLRCSPQLILFGGGPAGSARPVAFSTTTKPDADQRDPAKNRLRQSEQRNQGMRMRA
ncbi:MAG: hypothetical protein JXR83_03560, partial [Deltaproteobacteria bacterium]|nr:hypothetical protein [Deltaproteobacteria bacterium]